MKKSIFLSVLVLGTLFISCNKFLDITPPSDITPDDFLKSEADLATYTISRYNFPIHSGYSAGTFTRDNNTDNQATSSASSVWAVNQSRVPTDEGEWNFEKIRQINYFLDVVVPRYQNGEIQGNAVNIRHYIGEAYFLRAYEYFSKLQALGDFPIIEKVLPDDKQKLVEASKRRPRNEVARFILSDLDKAISMLKSGSVENKNRISKEVAQLFKSRVALYEGTWLKYHSGTPFVPGGPGWPGSKMYPDFNLDINAESNFFLKEAMSASKAVADAVTLESNTHMLGDKLNENKYYMMFADADMSTYNEVLLWRAYNAEFGTQHYVQHFLKNGANTGYTKGLVDAFLMKNGLPIYASGSGYAGDESIEKVRTERDERLQMFVIAPGDVLYVSPKVVTATVTPNILDIAAQRAVTGYAIKKGINPNTAGAIVGSVPSPNATVVFRASEAYLNYIEADYVLNQSLDADAQKYWKALRARAGVSEDYNATIAATDLNQEQDWAKFSAGQTVDATLYNIRRERRCEFIAEGMRWSDLKRWRALDQVSGYQIEGFNLWAKMYEYYKDGQGNSLLRSLPESDSNVSASTRSTYLRPYQIVQENNLYYNGYTWTKANYLSPIAYSHFLNASENNNAENSVIYQNPYWPIQADGLPTE